MTAEEYKEWLNKFEAKHTTDECFTPPMVYDAVVDFTQRELTDLTNRQIIRPFYPKGDYEKEEYPDNCIVIDNPPFSIFSKIVDFYKEKEIDFVLFYDARNLHAPISRNLNIIPMGSLTFENGAVIASCLVTNLGEYRIIADDKLKAAAALTCKPKRQIQQYSFPEGYCNIQEISKLENCRIKNIDIVKVWDPVTKKSCWGGYAIKMNEELKQAKAKAKEAKAKAKEAKAKAKEAIQLQVK